MAVVVLTCFCFLYYNIPVDYPNRYGTTDILWYPDTLYLRATEGFGSGRTNNEGFLESLDYHEGMPVDYLLMGSSQVEGFQVSQRDTIAEQLNALMPDKTTYSIGISGHTLLPCFSNLDAALKRYHPRGAVIFETDQLYYSVGELQSAIDGTIPEMTGNYGGIFELLSRNQFLRLAYKQLKEYRILMGQRDAAEATDAATTDEAKETDYLNALDALFRKGSELCEVNNAAIVIVYHPKVHLSENGEMAFDTDPDAMRSFRDCCERYNIIFVDMTEPFAQLYRESYKLPYGFINSRVGVGHLNADGLRMISEQLYAVLSEQE